MFTQQKISSALRMLFVMFLQGGFQIASGQIVPPDGTSFNAAPESSQWKTFYVASGTYNWVISPNTTGMAIEGPTSGNGVTVVYTPNSSSATCPTTNSYTLTATRIGPGASPAPLPITACKQATAPVGSTPVEIVMVVDVSGSMGDYAICPECPAGMDCDRASATTGSKLDYLKEKLLTAFHQLTDYFELDNNNKIAVVPFETTVVASQTVPLTPFHPVSAIDIANFDKIGELFGTGANSLQPLGTTAMGAGLLQAKTFLDGGSATAKKVILLFTNGIQNEPPYASVALDPPISGENTVFVGTTPIPRNIEIIPYAIFSPSERYNNLLKLIAEVGGATNRELFVSPFVCEVSQPLKQHWVNSAEAIGSPKMVYFKNGTLSGNSGQETFSIKENMDRLSIAISSVGNHDYPSLKVEKTDGTNVDLSPLGEFIPPLGIPAQHRVFTVTFPAGPVTNTAGDYRVNFTATQTNLDYDLSAIVDDRGLKQHFFATNIVPSGETMQLGAHLFKSGTGIPDANVKAIVYRPKKRLGNGFAGKKVPGRFISVKGPWGPIFPNRGKVIGTDILHNDSYKSKTNDAFIKQISIHHPTLPSFQSEGSKMLNGEKKYLVLLNETSFDNVFDQEIIATIPLVHQNDGVYRGVFKGTKKTGIYHVRFEASGTHPQIGTYLRREERTPLVRFGTPDKRKSCLYLLYDYAEPIILLKPVDVNCNLLGPNQVSAISITASSGNVGKLVDYLDGRYVFAFSPAASESDPTISIRIHDRLLFYGRLSEIRSKNAYFSIHGGLAFPKADFDAEHGRGFYGEAKLGMRVYKQWSVQMKGGYYAFADDETDKTDYAIWAFGPGVTYRYWTNWFTGIYLEGALNGGFYKPESSDWGYGYNAEVAIQKPLTHFLSLSVGVAAHRAKIKTEQIQFSTIGLGLQCRF